jgi:hypothetical protein
MRKSKQADTTQDKKSKSVSDAAPSLVTIKKYASEIGAHQETGESSGEVGWGEIETRKFQPKFRKILDHAYGGKCPVTDSIGEQVEAAHIHVAGTSRADWRNDNSRGILLDLKLHKAYDYGRLNIDPITGLMKVVDACRTKPEFTWLMDLADGKTVPIVNIHNESTWPALKAQRQEAELDQIAARLKAVKSDAGSALSKDEKLAEMRACAAELSALMPPCPYEDDDEPSQSPTNRPMESAANDEPEVEMVRQRMTG